jgi:predicted O-methyltransferase YrrM
MADVHSRAGERYADEAIRGYVDRLHAPHDHALTLAFQAPAREGMPAIQVAQSEGKLLGMLIALTGAHRVVEVGSLAGYSALRIARALPDGGKLWSIEYDPRHAEVARASVQAAGLTDRVEVLVGTGVDVLDRLVPEGPFDAVFIDADKANYDHYGRWARANLRAGGLLLGDNAYLFGRLLEQSPEAAAMRRFHEEAAASFDTVCIPTPDGLLLGIKRPLG